MVIHKAPKTRTLHIQIHTPLTPTPTYKYGMLVPNGRGFRRIYVSVKAIACVSGKEGRLRGDGGLVKGSKSGAVNSVHGASMSRDLQQCTNSHDSK